MTTDLKRTPTRTVWAVDVLATAVSLAKIAEPEDLSTAPRPLIGLATMPPSGVSHTPITQWKRTETLADEVFAKLTKDGAPTLVVVSKQQWGPHSARTAPSAKRGAAGKRGAGIAVQADATAQRRMGVQYAIEHRLHRAGIAVAEFPYPTALAWMLQGAQVGTGLSVMTALGQAVEREWGIVRPVTDRAAVTDDDGNVIRAEATVSTPFRPQVAALAAVGAMAVGIATSIEVTEPRLEKVRGTGNLAVQFPPSLRCPETLEGWQKRHDTPILLTLAD